MKIVNVVGARPNFMKIAPLMAEYKKHSEIEPLLVHTGQHYDDKMSRAFFEALSIPEADINLGIGSGTHAEQVGHTMIAFEKVLKEHKPDWVIVVGDVNATCACSITAKKEHVKVAHIEAGLRSFDLKMPEEINRMVTDRLSDLLLTPCKISGENLRSEGVSDGRVRFVGNVMIDTLEAQRDKASALDIGDIILQNQLLQASIASSPSLDRFAVMTIHRPSNVDEKEVLEPIINFLCDEVAGDMPLLWPMHPRAIKQLKTFGLWERVVDTENMVLLHPLGYHELLRLNMDATVMLTDSGGLQEECCVLGTPCLTLRWNTERPVTLTEHGGASVLVGNSVDQLREAYRTALKSDRNPQRPELWDGRTAQRIVEAILEQGSV